MTEKFIEIKDGIYVVTDGDFKIVNGHFTEEKLKEIYQLAEKIETIKDEKKYYEKEISNVAIMKKNAKNSLGMRIIPVCGFIATIIITPPVNLVGLIFTLVGYVGLQILVEKAIKMICGTKKERDEIEKKAISMLKSLNHHQKVHEKTLEELKEKTQYKEIPYEGNRIVKPVFDELDNKTEKTDDSNELQNNAGLLNQTYENARRYNFGTIIANSGRWAGYEDISADYPSKMARECSCRTERDDTIEMGVLYRHLEDDEDEISQEQSGPVKKLTLPRNTGNK